MESEAVQRAVQKSADVPVPVSPSPPTGKEKMICFDVHSVACWMFKSMLLLALIMVLSGCEVTDPYWQARETNPQSVPPCEPSPPYQWQFMGIPNK
jgi:hypothetical protein